MPRPKLQNYLRTHRKRSAFSQQELAFLLGSSSPTKVSRHELFERQPDLTTALAYEAIFGTPVSDLFAGLHQQIDREVIARAKVLARNLQNTPADRLTARKLEMLRLIIVAPDIVAENQ